MTVKDELLKAYESKKNKIENKLNVFKQVSKDAYFYELCFCFCTPQSKARAAMLVQEKLEQLDFKHTDFDPIEILSDKQHYIRFHRQKSDRLMLMKTQFDKIETIIFSNLDKYSKRNWLAENVKGIGYKEASHFMRNIAYTELAILDRHILKYLVKYNVFEVIPDISSPKKYLSVEQSFLNFANNIGIPIDHLDLLFWSEGAGDEILK
ncbi:MAG TPA: DNA lyase [Candidatus Kapabacteria bacterium]|nr:DNA lyase [Candidatus Kapabacteria bacterium]